MCYTFPSCKMGVNYVGIIAVNLQVSKSGPCGVVEIVTILKDPELWSFTSVNAQQLGFETCLL